MRRPADVLRVATETPPSELAAQFEVRYTRILDADGRARGPFPEPFSDPRALVSLYEEMLALRLFDAKAVALQRTGRLGTYPSCLGQEATAIALGRAMAREDVLLATYRETGTMLARGVRMEEIFLYWSGDERGSAYSGPGTSFCTPARPTRVSS